MCRILRFYTFTFYSPDVVLAVCVFDSGNKYCIITTDCCQYPGRRRRRFFCTPKRPDAALVPLIPRVKWLEREACHLPFSAEVKNE
jgi:hypothetical protein